jgi:hypothetical protein
MSKFKYSLSRHSNLVNKTALPTVFRCVGSVNPRLVNVDNVHVFFTVLVDFFQVSARQIYDVISFDNNFPTTLGTFPFEAKFFYNVAQSKYFEQQASVPSKTPVNAYIQKTVDATSISERSIRRIRTEYDIIMHASLSSP